MCLATMTGANDDGINGNFRNELFMVNHAV
jgi:hypothetical protein